MFFSQIDYENSPLDTQICEAATIFLAFSIFYLKYAHNSIFNFHPKRDSGIFHQICRIVCLKIGSSLQLEGPGDSDF